MLFFFSSVVVVVVLLLKNLSHISNSCWIFFYIYCSSCFHTNRWIKNSSHISNSRWILQSVAYTAAPFFIIGAIWFLVFGLCLTLICLCYCCCRREPYGYSRFAYALSLILLTFFTIAAMYTPLYLSLVCICGKKRN